MLANSTRPTDLVLDPFGGSGSTLVACEALGRSCRTLEIDPRYCDVIVRRWENLRGDAAIRVPAGELLPPMISSGM
jgi:DNA modification methylase